MASNLIEVKRALAEKYERLARLAGSKPKQTHYRFHADRFRRQIRKLEQG